jgi:drug/metabolite transporter (DMT)-like permease
MLFYTVGEILSKKYANTGSLKFGFWAVFSYCFVLVLWLRTLRLKNTLTVLSTIWDIFYVIAAIFVGVILFKEHLNAYNYVGLVFAMIALILLCK